jgi:hypothetical protein
MAYSHRAAFLLVFFLLNKADALAGPGYFSENLHGF